MVHSKTCDDPPHLAWGPGLVSRSRHASAIVLAALLCVLTTAWSDSRLAEQSEGVGEPSELIYVPPARFLRAVALGYDHALANVLWFRTINYFGNHYRGDRVYTWLAYMCDVVTDLDPRAEHVYSFGGILLPWEADRVDDGIALLEKGTRNMPDSWRMHYMLGFSYYFFKNDLDAASRALERATRLPDTPEFVSRVAATILAAHQGTNNALAFLTELEAQAPNPEMHSALQQRIRELTLAADIDALQAAVGEFEARFSRRPSDLTELVSAGIIARVPKDPFGGRYVVDQQSGEIRSSTGEKPRRMGSSQIRETFLKRQGLEH